MKMLFNWEEQNEAAKEDKSDYTLLPRGNYNFEIIKIEERSIKNGSSKNVWLKIPEGERFAKRMVFDMIIDKSSNPLAVNLGFKKMKNLFEAAGIEFNADADTDMLIGREVGAEVDIEKGMNGYSDKNIIKKYKKMEVPF